MYQLGFKLLKKIIDKYQNLLDQRNQIPNSFINKMVGERFFKRRRVKTRSRDRVTLTEWRAIFVPEISM